MLLVFDEMKMNTTVVVKSQDRAKSRLCGLADAVSGHRACWHNSKHASALLRFSYRFLGENKTLMT